MSENEDEHQTKWDNMLSSGAIPKSFKQYFEDEETFLLKNVKKGTSLLDIGSGDGRSFECLINTCSRLVGLDHEEYICSKGAAKFKKLGGSAKVEFVNSEASKQPFKTNTFDYVITMLTFVNFASERLTILKEMDRVCKNDGRILITTYSDDAFEDRKKVYDQSTGYKKIEGTTVFFNDGSISEQFSPTELKEIFADLEWDVLQCEKKGLGVFCVIKKRK